MRRSILLVSSLVLLAATGQALAQQASRTGTHLDTRTLHSQVEVFNPADVIDRIRTLLAEGDKQAALQLALEHVAAVQAGSTAQDSLRRYFAYNSLCTVYTSLNEIDSAIAACDQAIRAEPGRWSALNNRGTARLVAEDFSGALADYTAAQALAPAADAGIQATLEHNLALARAGLGAPE